MGFWPSIAISGVILLTMNKRIHLWFQSAAAFAVTLRLSADVATAAAVASEGFRPLFNGKDLDGWVVRQSDNHDWRVVDGVIDCDPHPEPGDRNLWTVKSYRDFELLVDWRIKESPYTNGAAKIILLDGTYKKDAAGKEILKAQLPGVPIAGPIALQHHGDRRDGEWGASLLQFRNIYIKELQ